MWHGSPAVRRQVAAPALRSGIPTGPSQHDAAMCCTPLKRLREGVVWAERRGRGAREWWDTGVHAARPPARRQRLALPAAHSPPPPRHPGAPACACESPTPYQLAIAIGPRDHKARFERPIKAAPTRLPAHSPLPTPLPCYASLFAAPPTPLGCSASHEGPRACPPAPGPLCFECLGVEV